MFFYGAVKPSEDAPCGEVRYDNIAWAASIITLLGYLPQVFAVAKTNNVQSFSNITLIANCVASIMWIAFGYLNNIVPNILSGVAFFCMNIYFLYLSLKK